MTASCPCGATWTGTKVEHCTACHLSFSCTKSGDMHRAGPPTDRRCLTDETLVRKGLRTKLNAQGTFVWLLPGVRPVDAINAPAGSPGVQGLPEKPLSLMHGDDSAGLSGAGGTRSSHGHLEGLKNEEGAA